jgi:hypothetical protein
MTNHNTPQLSRMDLANHCADFPGLSRLNTRAVQLVHSSLWQYKEMSGQLYYPDALSPGKWPLVPIGHEA